MPQTILKENLVSTKKITFRWEISYVIWKKKKLFWNGSVLWPNHNPITKTNSVVIQVLNSRYVGIQIDHVLKYDCQIKMLRKNCNI